MTFFYEGSKSNFQQIPTMTITKLHKYSAYYSNARFLLLALRQLLDAIQANDMEVPTVTFAYDDGTALTLQEIHDNLVESMDLIFRYFAVGYTSISDKERDSDLYRKTLNLFKNHHSMPDGSAIYGVLLNSFSVAVNGFGDSSNHGPRSGSDVIMDNVKIDDMKLRVNEVIAMYFERCGDVDAETQTIQKGPFGDVIDIAKMIPRQQADAIMNQLDPDLSELVYTGNPLSDAQIALYIHKDYVGDGKNYAFGAFVSDYLIGWAVNGNIFPSQCVGFICNGDIMFHTNKGNVTEMNTLSFYAQNLN